MSTRSNQYLKSALLPTISKYLNDTSNVIWSSATITEFMNQADVEITQDINFLWQRAPLSIVLNQNTYSLPPTTKSITRITYRGYKVYALDQKQVSLLSPVYRTQNSLPRWYTLQFEGTYTLRFYPGPSENLPGLSTGVQVYTDVNILNECVISSYQYSDESYTYFSAPDYFNNRLVRYYVMWKCYSQEGNGQDLIAASYFKDKFENEMEECRRLNALQYANKERQFTDLAIQRPFKPARPILPPTFGTIIDY